MGEKMNKFFETKKMKIKIFADNQLHQHIIRGWSIEKLISGQIKTLTGKTITLEVDPQDTILKVKQKIEDAEGIEIKDQELRKGTKILQDSETLYDAFVMEDSTLLLVLPVDTTFNNYQKDEDQPSVMSTKLKGPTIHTKTITLDPEEQQSNNKYQENQQNTKKPWWDNKVMSSGPMGHRASNLQLETPSTTTSPSTESDISSSTTELISPAPTTTERIDDPDEERRKRLLAIEARLGSKKK